MNLTEIIARIDERIDELRRSGRPESELTDKAISRAAGKPDAIRNMRRGAAGEIKSTTTGIDTLAAIADVLGTTLGRLIGDKATVPVVGFITPSSRLEYFHNETGKLERIPSPEGAKAKMIAVEVRGDTLGPALNGWYAYYEGGHKQPIDELLGRMCIVSLSDGGVAIKILKPGQIAGRFNLESCFFGPPLYDQQVEWAAPILHVAAKP